MPARARTRNRSVQKSVIRSRRPRPAVRKKLWMFDFDNTLARLEPEVDWAASRLVLEPMLREAGVPDDLFEKHPRGNLLLYNDMRARLLDLARDGRAQRSFRSAQVRQIVRRASKIVEKFELAGVDRAAPLEGAIELLRQLKRSGAKVAIVTSNSSRTIRRWLALHKLTGAVDAIVGRDSYLALKPSPESVTRALDLCKTRPADAAFVGDADSDYAAASALEVEFFGVASNQTSRDRLTSAGVARMFSSPAALGIHLNLLDSPAIAGALSAALEHAAR
jgi:HAD superfamily hydrolase (TIGR01549 family)